MAATRESGIADSTFFSTNVDVDRIDGGPIEERWRQMQAMPQRIQLGTPELAPQETRGTAQRITRLTFRQFVEDEMMIRHTVAKEKPDDVRAQPVLMGSTSLRRLPLASLTLRQRMPVESEQFSKRLANAADPRRVKGVSFNPLMRVHAYDVGRFRGPVAPKPFQYAAYTMGNLAWHGEHKKTRKASGLWNCMGACYRDYNVSMISYETHPSLFHELLGLGFNVFVDNEPFNSETHMAETLSKYGFDIGQPMPVTGVKWTYGRLEGLANVRREVMDHTTGAALASLPRSLQKKGAAPLCAQLHYKAHDQICRLIEQLKGKYSSELARFPGGPFLNCREPSALTAGG